MKKTLLRNILICLMLFALLPVQHASAEDLQQIPAVQETEPQALRVLLSRLNIADRLDVTLHGSYSAELDGARLMFGRGSDLAILLNEGRMYLYYADMRVDAGTDFTLRRHPVTDGLVNCLRFANNPALYEGDLRLTVTDDRIRLILTIGVEDYLHGVVPYEMSESWPLEALKAQAVAARTYAVSKAQANAGREYDLVDTTNDQVYKGRREEYVNAANAIEQTSGVCGFYKDKLAVCYYSASNGGQTELAEHVWGTKADYGYLDMRDDPYDLENTQSKVQRVTIPKQTTDVAEAPYALRLLLSTQLQDTLAAAGYDPAPESLRVDQVTSVTVDTPRFSAPSRLYTMLHITFAYSARTRTDAPAQPAPVDMADDAEVSLFTPEVTSTPQATETAAPTEAAESPAPTPVPTPTPTPVYGAFIAQEEPVTLSIPIFPEAEKLLSLGINSYDNEMITVTEQADSFTVEARRFGHGVGMSQRGAEIMAGKYSMSYTDILAFYYPGMTLMRYDVQPQALATVAPPLTQTAGPVPTPTPRPTLMPVTEPLPHGAWYATVSGIDDDSSLNLRASPDIAAEVLMRLYKNQQLIVLEECPQEDWVRVKTDAIEGYVMERFLTQERIQ